MNKKALVSRPLLEHIAKQFEAFFQSKKKLKIPSNTPTSWQSYIESRNLDSWLVDKSVPRNISPVDDDKYPDQLGLRFKFMTKLLTYPLMTSMYLSQLAKPQINSATVCIIGARAEAILRPLYWNEIMFCNNTLDKINLIFIGPHVPIFKQNIYSHECSFTEERKQKVSRALYSKKFKDLPEILKKTNSKPDLLCFFNSGIGTSIEQKHWQGDNVRSEFINIMEQLNAPSLFTSFNEDDFNKDLSCPIATDLGSDKKFHLTQIGQSPFRSYWEEQSQANVFINHSAFIAELRK